MVKIYSQPELACGTRERINGHGARQSVEVSRPKPHAGYGHRIRGIGYSSQCWVCAYFSSGCLLA